MGIKEEGEGEGLGISGLVDFGERGGRMSHI